MNDGVYFDQNDSEVIVIKRDCHNCILFASCADRCHRNAVDCKRFRFCSMCKST